MKKEKQGFPLLYPNAAGIDISSKEHYVAINPGLHEECIKRFGSFTADLISLSKWLTDNHVDTVAMEATGIYWVSLYLILEEAGFDVVLVNAKHVKNVRGKKTDIKDAEWIRQLHSCGLLSNSFQPDAYIRTLRTYMRHRKNLLEMAATHIRMMQKALEQMNIKLHTVIADITGKSGQAIIHAILGGERNPASLIQLLDGRIKANRDDVRKSLEGIWKEEHIFELRQSYDLYHYYRSKIDLCDLKIQSHLNQKSGSTQSIEIEEKKRLSKSNKNNLNFDARQILYHITGTDLTRIYGITDTNALEIISEVGLNMTKWPTVKHFTSWLHLAPNNRISGGKLLSSKTGRKKNKAGQIFKMAAFAVQRGNHWLSAFYHRIKMKAGTPKAIVATARKIAVIFYKLMKEKTSFNPVNIEQYAASSKEYQIKRLRKQAQKLGLSLTS